MKSGEETVAWLIDTVWHAHDRPQLYARTLGELECACWLWHFLIAEILGAHGDFIEARSRLMAEHTEYDRVAFSDESLSRIEPGDRDRYNPVVKYWMAVDHALTWLPHNRRE